MLRVFFDTSVLFAAAYSATGYARDLIKLVLRDEIGMVISSDILTETERNLTRKAPEKVAAYRQLIALLEPEITPDPSAKEIQTVEEYVVKKDAPIIAAAINARPDYFVTYDRKDLLDKPEVAEKSGLKIVTPEVVVKFISPDEE